jgi:hypothetical protein
MVDDVMGAAEVRNSVYSLRPGDLSMVAGRVARNVGASAVDDSSAPGDSDAHRGEGAGGSEGRPGRQAGGFAEQVGRAGQEAGDWASRLGERIAVALSGDPSGVHRHAEKQRRARRQRDDDPPAPASDGEASYVTREIDPLATSTRVWLALACAAVAVAAAAFMGEVRQPLGIGLVMVLGICGGMAGVMFAYNRFDLKDESPMLYRLAFGGLACIGVMVPALVVASNLSASELGLKHSRYRDEFLSSLVAAGLAMFLINWRNVVDPKRKDRVSLWRATWAGMAGAISGLVADADDFLFITALMAGATSLGAQLLTPQRRARRIVPVPDPPAGEPATNAPPGAGAGARHAGPSPSPEDKLTCLICAGVGVFGVCGIQRMAVGKVWTGLLYFFTLGLFGIGQVLDVILILAGRFTDAQGRPVVQWEREPPGAPRRGLPGSMAGPNVPSVQGARRAVGRLGSALMGLAGGLIMLVSLGLGLVWATRLPFVLRGVEGYELAHVEPMLITRVLELAMWLAALLAAVLMTLLRRRQGAAAMFRGVLGLGLLVGAVFALAESLGPVDASWYLLVGEQLDGSTPGKAVEMYLERFDPWGGLASLGLVMAGVFALAWTPEPRNTPPVPAGGRDDGKQPTRGEAR